MVCLNSFPETLVTTTLCSKCAYTLKGLNLRFYFTFHNMGETNYCKITSLLLKVLIPMPTLIQ